MRHYALHGYVLSTPLDLPLPRTASPGDAPQLVADIGDPREVPVTPPDGTCIAQLDDEAHHVYYSFAKHEDGSHTLRFNGTLDVVGDAALHRVTAYRDPGADPGVVPILLAGAVVATRLILDGRLVLHASAVAFDDSPAVAVVGAAGMGKSTLATLLCTAGGQLLTDDVARVDLDGDALVWRGSVETRLRQQARSLVDRLPTAGTRLTADGRTALRPQGARVERSRLGLLVVPRPHREATEVSVQRLAPADALPLLASFPRIVGWRDMTQAQTQFLRLADLVEAVPVVRLSVPWGPPFAPDLGEQVRSRLAAFLS